MPKFDIRYLYLMDFRIFFSLGGLIVGVKYNASCESGGYFRYCLYLVLHNYPITE